MPKMPGVNHLDAIRALERAGYIITRQGKPVVMQRGKDRVVIPRGHSINAFTMGGIVRDAGLTAEEFKNLL